MKRKVWRMTPAPVKVLHIISFLMNMGFYALIPYLTLHLTNSYFWTVAMAGLLLGVRQFSQQGFAFLGGVVSDLCGYKGTMILGLLVRAAGFSLFAFCTQPWHFFAAAILSGLGGAVFEPASAAGYAVLTPEEIRKEVFAFRNVLTNTGVVGSQIVGTILASVDFFWLSLFSGLLYVLGAAMAFVSLPAIQARNTGVKWYEGIGHVFHNRRFLRFTAILIGYYYVYMQIFLSVPQLAEDVLHSKTGVGVVLSTVSLTIILLQMKMINWLEGYTQRFTLIGIGALVMGIGLFLLTFADSLWMLMVDAFIFALGTTVSIPYLIDMVPRFAPKEHLGAYYGFNSYSLAFGGSIGTFCGGWMYDLGLRWQMGWLPWSVCLLVGAAVAWGLHQMEEKTPVEGVSLKKIKSVHKY